MQKKKYELKDLRDINGDLVEEEIIIQEKKSGNKYKAIGEIEGNKLVIEGIDNEKKLIISNRKLHVSFFIP